MSPLIWATILLILGLGLVLLEVFVPSGGIIGFLSFSSLIASLVLAFSYHPGVGLGFLAVVIMGTPVIVMFGFQWFPYTPVGKLVVLQAPTNDNLLPDEQTWGGLRDLIGHVGRAKTLMLPSGAITINGRSVDAVSQGIPIEVGQLVRVVEVHGTRVVVLPIDESQAANLEIARKADDPLSRPIESLGIDPFEQPLT